jgi:D-sedoheptulose 7-phosphate isomerase
MKLDLNSYSSSYSQKILDHLQTLNLKEFKKFLNKLKEIKKKKKNKILLLGNGGSAAMASHVSVDLTKQCGIRAINFNEADLITCFGNDYGYENWMKEAIKKYYDKGDLIILISSSGNSRNHVVAGNYCKKNKISLITFTGFNGKNKLSKLGGINFYLNSKNFNQIEMVHHIWLLMACDFLTKEKF